MDFSFCFFEVVLQFRVLVRGTIFFAKIDFATAQQTVTPITDKFSYKHNIFLINLGMEVLVSNFKRQGV